MPRAVSSAQLEIRVARAKRREAAQLAAKTSATPKPYTPEPETIIVKAQLLADPAVFVKIPVTQANWDRIPAGTKTALGVTLESVALPNGASMVDFKGNHKGVVRCVVHEGLTTPRSKTTSWGTRVVKKTEKSFSFPVGNSSFDALATAFKAAFASPDGSARALLGTGTYGYAELKIGSQTLVKVKAG